MINKLTCTSWWLITLFFLLVLGVAKLASASLVVIVPILVVCVAVAIISGFRVWEAYEFEKVVGVKPPITSRKKHRDAWMSENRKSARRKASRLLLRAQRSSTLFNHLRGVGLVKGNKDFNGSCDTDVRFGLAIDYVHAAGRYEDYTGSLLSFGLRI